MIDVLASAGEDVTLTNMLNLRNHVCSCECAGEGRFIAVACPQCRISALRCDRVGTIFLSTIDPYAGDSIAAAQTGAVRCRNCKRIFYADFVHATWNDILTSGADRKKFVKVELPDNSREEPPLVGITSQSPLEQSTVSVNVAALQPYNSYGDPEFVQLGYYRDVPFECRDCSKSCVWTAAAQKYWYEEVKGFVYSTAIRCEECRKKERLRRKRSNMPFDKSD